jgi:hypothetical protein
MLGKRTKHSFSFESFDNYNPYNIQDSGVKKKISVFNYSTVYFRKKQSDIIGTYLMFGGNIPSGNMLTSKTFESTAVNTDGTQKPPILCTLNTSNAIKGRELKIHNLSPNYPVELPKNCLSWENTNAELNFEGGNDQKPNFMYVPTYQPSCSTHPRAAGYAHEDNYDCLRYFKSGAKKSKCCDEFRGCASRFSVFAIYPNKEFIINNGEPGTELIINGVKIPEFIFGEPVSNLQKFYCNDSSPTGGSSGIDLCDNIKDCDERNCDFGIVIPAPLAPSYNLSNSFRNCKSEQLEDGSLKILMSAGLSIKFFGSGNKNCSCSGHGSIFVSGYKECVRCAYVIFKEGLGITDRFCTNECTDNSEDPKPYCDCVFTGEFDFKNSIIDTPDKIYISTLQWPTYKFNNWANINIVTGGSAESGGCGTIMNCDDVN